MFYVAKSEIRHGAPPGEAGGRLPCKGSFHVLQTHASPQQHRRRETTSALGLAQVARVEGEEQQQEQKQSTGLGLAVRIDYFLPLFTIVKIYLHPDGIGNR